MQFTALFLTINNFFLFYLKDLCWHGVFYGHFVYFHCFWDLQSSSLLLATSQQTKMISKDYKLKNTITDTVNINLEQVGLTLFPSLPECNLFYSPPFSPSCLLLTNSLSLLLSFSTVFNMLVNFSWSVLLCK